MPAKKWNKLKGFPDYEVSLTGRVRSWVRQGKPTKKTKNKRTEAPRLLLGKDFGKVRRYTLKNKDGQYKTVFVDKNGNRA